MVKTSKIAKAPIKGAPTNPSTCNTPNTLNPKRFTQTAMTYVRKHPRVVFTCINLVVLFLAYWRFCFNVHFSMDTYAVYDVDDAITNIRNGRVLGFVIGKLNYLLNLSNTNVQLAITALFLLVLAICAANLAYRFCAFKASNKASRNKNNKVQAQANNFKHSAYANPKSVNSRKNLPSPQKAFPFSFSTGLVINLAIVLIFTNGFFLDWMRFVECYTMLYAPAIILLTAAVLLTFNNKVITLSLSLSLARRI